MGAPCIECMVSEPLAAARGAALLSGMVGADRGAVCMECQETAAAAADSLGVCHTGAETGAWSRGCEAA